MPSCCRLLLTAIAHAFMGLGTYIPYLGRQRCSSSHSSHSVTLGYGAQEPTVSRRNLKGAP